MIPLRKRACVCSASRNCMEHWLPPCIACNVCEQDKLYIKSLLHVVWRYHPCKISWYNSTRMLHFAWKEIYLYAYTYKLVCMLSWSLLVWGKNQSILVQIINASSLPCCVWSDECFVWCEFFALPAIDEPDSWADVEQLDCDWFDWDWSVHCD